MPIRFHLNGKEIDLTGDNITIASNSLNIDKNGNMILTGEGEDKKGSIIQIFENNSDKRNYSRLNPNVIYFEHNSSPGHSNQDYYTFLGTMANGCWLTMEGNNKTSIQMINDSSEEFTLMSIENKITGEQTRIFSSKIEINGRLVLSSKELYNSSSGTTGTVSLTESCSSFQFLDISYCTNNSDNYTTTRVYSPNGKTVALFIPEASDNLVFRAKKISISGSSITVSKANYTQISSENLSIPSFNNTDYIKIVKVVGYK